MGVRVHMSLDSECQIVSNISFVFLHNFSIQPIVNCVCCHLVFCCCFKARSLIRILPYQSL